MSKLIDDLIVKKQQEIQRLVELNNKEKEEGHDGRGQAAAALSLSGSRKSLRSLLGLR